MNLSFDNEETLPNGIYVRRKIIFVECELSQVDKPWIASINIGPWHYSQGGSTKEMAINNIFEYMQDMKKQFETQLKRDHERLDTLNLFLATDSNLEFCKCSYYL